MKFDLKHTYDKPAAAVLKMYSDKAFFEKKYKEIGAWDVAVLEHEKSSTKFRIKCRYSTKNDAPLPDFAKKFLGESTIITQSDTWDLVKMTGKIEIEIKNTPVKASAEMTLKNAGSGSTNDMKWNVSCSIPLIGGKLESVVADDVKAKSKIDEAASRKILAAY